MSGLYSVNPSAADSPRSSALSGAASGAAAGTAISPGLGTVIGAGIGAVGDIFGGIFGNKAQQQANKTNLQIARENNALQRELAEQNNALQLEMFNRQMAFNTPAQQRKMLEQAGINPYAMVENGYTAQSAPSSPNLQLPNFQQGIVNPVNAFANNLGTIGRDFAEVTKTLAEADLMKSETVGKKIDNAYKAPTAESNLNLIGQQGTALALDNEIKADTMAAQKSTKIYESEVAKNQAQLTLNQAVSAEINAKLLEKYGDKVQNAQLEKLLSEVNYIDEQSATLKVQQLLGYANIHLSQEQAKAVIMQAKAAQVQAQAAYRDSLANLKNANTNAMLGKANVRLINLKADEQEKLNKMLQQKVDWFQKNGYTQMSMELENLHYSIKKNKASIEQLYACADMMNYMGIFYHDLSEKVTQETNWIPFDKMNEMLRSFTGAVSAGSSAAGNLLPLAGVPAGVPVP